MSRSPASAAVSRGRAAPAPWPSSLPAVAARLVGGGYKRAPPRRSPEKWSLPIRPPPQAHALRRQRQPHLSHPAPRSSPPVTPPAVAPSTLPVHLGAMAPTAAARRLRVAPLPPVGCGWRCWQGRCWWWPPPVQLPLAWWQSPPQRSDAATCRRGRPYRRLPPPRFRRRSGRHLLAATSPPAKPPVAASRLLGGSCSRLPLSRCGWGSGRWQQAQPAPLASS